jgi:DNA-binding MarR family transcriptional regulator
MVLHARDSLSKRRLKMWIRLLGVTRASERHLREFLRVEHGTTLPRFDVMAALWRRREGLTMSELGRLLLVSGGNVTVIVDGLEREGLVIRVHSSADRRTVAVSLTTRGLAEFERIAAGHEAEIDRLFAQLAESDLDMLNGIFRRLTREKT